MNTILLLIGAVLILDTIFILSRSNVNMGVLMPALLGCPLLMIGLFYDEAALWMSSGFGVWFKWILIFAYIGYILIVAVCSILIVREIRAGAPDGADAVIVLGAAVHGTKPCPALCRRLDLAAEYHRRTPSATVVVSGGKGPQEAITEAEAMRQYLLEHGIPEEKIVAEVEARSTYENFLFSDVLLKERFPQGYTAVFATNDFHIYRARIAAKKAGLGDIRGMGCRSPFYIVPNYYMREAMAIVRYAILGLR